MQTYKQYLIEEDDSWKHEVPVEQYINLDVHLSPGDIYYTDDEWRLHRTIGPAVIKQNGTKMWYKDGLRHREDGPAAIIFGKSKQPSHYWFYEGHEVNIMFDIPHSLQRAMILDDPENIKKIKNPSRVIQEYIITKRPDLMDKINNLDPKMREKYLYHLNQGDIEI
jgi:hypothetical protein